MINKIVNNLLVQLVAYLNCIFNIFISFILNLLSLHFIDFIYLITADKKVKKKAPIVWGFLHTLLILYSADFSSAAGASVGAVSAAGASVGAVSAAGAAPSGISSNSLSLGRTLSLSLIRADLPDRSRR